MKRQEGNVNACYQGEEARLTMAVHSRIPTLVFQKRQNYEDTNTNQELLGLARRERRMIQSSDVFWSRNVPCDVAMVGTCSMHLSKPLECTDNRSEPQ